MDKLAGIRIGDRVKITHEAEVVSLSPFELQNDGSGLRSRPNMNVIEAETFHIERIEKPINVGDKVSLKCTNMYGVVLAISNGRAWVEWDRSGHPIYTLASLVRAQ